MLIESCIDREEADVTTTMTIYPDFPVQFLIWCGGIGSTSTLLGH